MFAAFAVPKFGICFRALSHNSVHAHDGVLHVGSGLAFEAERVLEIERDDGRAREAQQKITQRADGDRVRDGRALLLGRFGVALINFLPRACLEPVEQVVGFHALALAAADFDVRFLGILGRNFVAHLLCAARGERDDVVREMLQIVGLLRMTEGAKARDDNLLRIRLPRVNDVEDFVRVAECGRVRVSRSSGFARRDPRLVAIGMLVKAAIVEIAAEQAEFPKW